MEDEGVEWVPCAVGARVGRRGQSRPPPAAGPVVPGEGAHASSLLIPPDPAPPPHPSHPQAAWRRVQDQRLESRWKSEMKGYLW